MGDVTEFSFKKDIGDHLDTIKKGPNLKLDKYYNNQIKYVTL